MRRREHESSVVSRPRGSGGPVATDDRALFTSPISPRMDERSPSPPRKLNVAPRCRETRVAVTSRILPSLSRREAGLWIATLLTYGLGDVLTTHLAIWLGAVEMNPALGLVHTHGLAPLVAWKLVVAAVAFAVFAAAGRRWLAPACLTAVGGAGVVWNLVVILA